MDDYEIGGDDFVAQMKAAKKRSNSSLADARELDSSASFGSEMPRGYNGAEREYRAAKSAKTPSYSKIMRRR